MRLEADGAPRQAMLPSRRHFRAGGAADIHRFAWRKTCFLEEKKGCTSVSLGDKKEISVDFIATSVSVVSRSFDLDFWVLESLTSVICQDMVLHRGTSSSGERVKLEVLRACEFV